MCMLLARVLMRTTDKLREVGDTARDYVTLDILELFGKVKKRSASVVLKIVVMMLNCGNKIKKIVEEESEKKSVKQAWCKSPKTGLTF